MQKHITWMGKVVGCGGNKVLFTKWRACLGKGVENPLLREDILLNLELLYNLNPLPSVPNTCMLYYLHFALQDETEKNSN